LGDFGCQIADFAHNYYMAYNIDRSLKEAKRLYGDDVFDHNHWLLEAISVSDGPEIWSPVLNYDFLYEVSNYGNIKSWGRNKKGGLLSLYETAQGYTRASFSKNKTIVGKFVHVLVAFAFVENPEKKPEVNHLYGIKFDNRKSQLEWSTKSENIQHAVMMGLWNPTKGSTNGMSKLLNEQVLDIFNSKESTKYLADKFKVTATTINLIKSGKTWSHITDKEYLRKRNINTIAMDIYNYSDDYTNKQIAEIFKTSLTMVTEIRNGTHYSEITGHKRIRRKVLSDQQKEEIVKSELPISKLCSIYKSHHTTIKKIKGII
jgi:hypothetical protein